MDKLPAVWAKGATSKEIEKQKRKGQLVAGRQALLLLADLLEREAQASYEEMLTLTKHTDATTIKVSNFLTEQRVYRRIIDDYLRSVE